MQKISNNPPIPTSSSIFDINSSGYNIQRKVINENLLNQIGDLCKKYKDYEPIFQKEYLKGNFFVKNDKKRAQAHIDLVLGPLALEIKGLSLHYCDRLI
jgi:hypothetical protein